MDYSTLQEVLQSPEFSSMPLNQKQSVFEQYAQNDEKFNGLSADAQNYVRQKYLTAPQQDTPLQTMKAFGKAALEEVPQTVGSAIGGTGGASLGVGLGALTGPAAPIAMPTLGLLGAFGGSVAGENLGEAAKENYMPAITGFGTPERQQEMEASPTATMLGKGMVDVAGLAIPAPNIFQNPLTKFASNKIWESVSPTQKAAAITAEDWGLKVKPSQLQTGANQHILSSTNNQNIVNSKAAEATGIAGYNGKIDQKFLDWRFKDLGKQYEKVYNDPALGQTVTLDNNASQALGNLLTDPTLPVPQRTKALLMRILPPNVGSANLRSYDVVGDDFRRAMSDLKSLVYKESLDGNTKFQLKNLLGDLNGSLETNNPAVAAKLQEINPKYAATMTLDKEFTKASNGAVDPHGDVDAFRLGEVLKGETRHPLYELGNVGLALGIGSKSRGAQRIGSSAGRTYMGVPLGVMRKIGDLTADSAIAARAQALSRGAQPNIAERGLSVGTQRATPLGMTMADLFSQE